jgi:uncharacterized membrane protein YozB (DUF420 family)
MSGFLSFARGSFMLDVVVIAMVAALPVLAYSIFLVKVKKQYELHKRIQITLGLIVGIAVVAFEVDMRLNGWQHLAEPSPYFDTWVIPSLVVHVICAVFTLILWVWTIWAALKRIPSPARPSSYSTTHKKLGWASTIGMFLTSITGWIFYWLAFVAS